MKANSSSSAIIFLLFTDFFHSNSDIRGRVVAGDTTSCTSGALYSPRSNWWERCFLMALQGIWAKSFTLLGPRRAILTAPETFRQSRPRRRFPRYRAAFESLVIVSRNEQPISWKDRASPLLVEEDEVFRSDPFMLAWFFSLFSNQNIVTRIWK